MATPNIPLLRQTLAHIESHPQEWVQDSYRCQTGMCFAGWAVTLDGGQWYSPDPTSTYGDGLVARPDDPAVDVWPLGDGTRAILASARAQRILGLDGYQAEDLFASYNTLDDIRQIVAELCEQGGGS